MRTHLWPCFNTQHISYLLMWPTFSNNKFWRFFLFCQHFFCHVQITFYCKQNTSLLLFALQSAVSFPNRCKCSDLILPSSLLPFLTPSITPSLPVSSASCEEIYRLQTQTWFTAHPYPCPSMPLPVRWLPAFSTWVALKKKRWIDLLSVSFYVVKNPSHRINELNWKSQKLALAGTFIST